MCFFINVLKNVIQQQAATYYDFEVSIVICLFQAFQQYKTPEISIDDKVRELLLMFLWVNYFIIEENATLLLEDNENKGVIMHLAKFTHLLNPLMAQLLI